MPKFTEDRYQENLPGSRLTPAEVEFAMAMERYMRGKRRPFPTWHEVLEVLLALGYRRVVTTPKNAPCVTCRSCLPTNYRNSGASECSLTWMPGVTRFDWDRRVHGSSATRRTLARGCVRAA